MLLVHSATITDIEGDKCGGLLALTGHGCRRALPTRA